MPKYLNETLIRSAQLENELLELIHLGTFDDSKRLVSSRILCGVSFEHAESVKMLIASRNFTSALGLLRLQYEAMVRATWLLYAAKESAVEKLSADLTQENEKRAQKMPMLSEMLSEMEGKAPEVAMDMIMSFKEYSWKPLSSYVHGGIHALNRHSKGYPIPLLIQILKASNGVLVMVGMLLIILNGSNDHSGKMPKIQIDFADCLPDFKKS